MITSVHNPRIKAARKLTERKERYAAGLLLAEGVRLIADAWQHGVRPVVLFYDPAIVAANPPAGELLAELEVSGCDCQPCAPDVFATLAGTVTPQGLVAVLPLPLHRPLPQPLTFALVLDAVRDPGNAGTLLRSAAAAGVQAVLFGPASVDPFNDKVLRAGMGAHFRVPLRLCPTWNHVREVLGEGPVLYLAEAAAALPYEAVDWRAPCALIVGGEAQGAGAEARAAATPIAIPMQSAVESLNAAVAGSVILFEAARQRRRAVPLP
jgi:TrmH family RNA methyltransferase